MYYFHITSLLRIVLEDTSMADTEAQGQRRAGFDDDVSHGVSPDELSIFPLGGVVIFPAEIVRLLISRGSSLKHVEDCRKSDSLLGLAAQKKPDEEDPAPNSLFSRGCGGRI